MNTALQISIESISQEQDFHLWGIYPAATSRGRFYLIHNDTIVGKMRLRAGRCFANGLYEFVTVEPEDDAADDFFRDDPFRIGGKIANLRYDGVTGTPTQGFLDEPEDRHKGTVIVDTLDFDFGIAHPRYKVVKGWANQINKPKPRVHESHSHRRPRSSNKIKKVA